jgi:ABC-type branched-subunit amino acid transport system ATPase component
VGESADGAANLAAPAILSTGARARLARVSARLSNGGAQLSGGEQQMLVGRALMTNPRLLVLDPATEGLAPDPRERSGHG